MIAARNLIIDPVTRFFKTTPIFLLYSLIFIYAQMCAPFFFPSSIPFLSLSPFSITIIFHLITAFLSFFLLPCLTTKFILQAPLEDIGFVLPNFNTRTIVSILIALIFLEFFVYYLNKYSTFFKTYYTLSAMSFFEFVPYMFLFPLYYFSEEFFFRGFLFINLWKRLKWHSFWITDIIFTLSHFNKPGLEILACIPASVVFNALTLSTRSIYPAIFVHTIFGITGIVLVNFV